MKITDLRRMALGLIVVGLALCQYVPPGGGSASIINGASVPKSAGILGSNSSGQLIQDNPAPVQQLQLSPFAALHAAGKYVTATDGSGDTALGGVCAVWGSSLDNTGILTAGSDGAQNCLMGSSGAYTLGSGLSLFPAFGGTVTANIVQLQGGAQPTCNSTNRGRIWQTFGSAGVSDTVAVCAKDMSDVYAWRTIF